MPNCSAEHVVLRVLVQGSGWWHWWGGKFAAVRCNRLCWIDAGIIAWLLYSKRRCIEGMTHRLKSVQYRNEIKTLLHPRTVAAGLFHDRTGQRRMSLKQLVASERKSKAVHAKGRMNGSVACAHVNGGGQKGNLLPWHGCGLLAQSIFGQRRMIESVKAAGKRAWVFNTECMGDVSRS